MNNEQVNQLIQGIGMMTELWIITYQGFTKQGMSNEEAIMHTKALMSIMVESFYGNSQEEK